MNEAEKTDNQQGNGVLPCVLSSFSLRCLELIERGNNTFASGWKEAITELVNTGKIKIEMEYNNGNIRVSKIV